MIEATTTATGAITELANTFGAATVDTATGTIKFTDADVTDTHTVTISSVTAAGVVSGLPVNATLLTFLTKGAVVEPSGTTPGAINWTFSAADKTFDYLGAGQTTTLSYVVTVTDSKATATTQTVTITVTGTNDAPILAAGSVTTGAITELAGATGSTTADTASGAIKFTDESGDTHTATISSVAATGIVTGLASNAVLLGWLSKGALVEQSGGTPGSLAWTFSAPDSAFDYLAAAQAVTLTYAVQIIDNLGAILTQNVTVTVTGTNDVPTIVTTGTIATGAITELANITASTTADTATGVIKFADADLADTHTLTVSSVTASGTTVGLPANATLLTFLSKGTVSEQVGATPGAIPWTFSAADKTFDYLATGQTATLTYVVTLADTHGGSITQNVVVTVTGTNDAPVAAVGTLTGAITERAGLTGSATADTATGLVKFTDVDTGDTHSATITGVVASGITTGIASNATLLGWLSKGAITEQVGATAGSVAWTFSAPDSAFDYLSVGQTATLTYTVAIADAAGAIVNQNVTVTITGTNDAPSAIAHSGLTTDNWTALTMTAATLLAGATDPDKADTLTLSSVQGAVGGTVALTGGNAVFTPTATAIGAASFTYTISDGHGGTSTATASLTTTLHQINGTAGNDTLAGSTKKAQIDGGAGNDIISAGSAGDTIIGGAGNDTLTGGAGIDTFVYHTGFGIDTINSFTATGTSHDLLQVDKTIFADWAHLLGATKQQGSDLLITLDPSDTITLKNVALANFTTADAVFV